MAHAWDNDVGGFVFGADNQLDSCQHFGLFAGVSRGQVETVDVALIETNIGRLFGGFYGSQSLFGNWVLPRSLVAGSGEHDGKRRVYDNLVGIETAQSDVGSFTISPWLKLAGAIAMEGGFEFRPAARLTYTRAWYESQRENGTTNSNLVIDGHGASVSEARLQLAVARGFSDNWGEVELRGGGQGRFYSDDNIDISLDGQRGRFAVPGETTIWLVGGKMMYGVEDTIDLSFDVEYARTSGGGKALSGYAGLNVMF